MIQKLLPLIIFLLFFFLFLIPVQDTDFGWHLRCGQQILEQGKFCQTNRFTTLLDGYQWYSPAHLYQVLIFLTFKYFGFAGIAFLYALTATAVFTFFVRSMTKNLLAGTLTTLIGIWFAWSTLNIGFRSQILSVYFLLIFLSLIKLSQNRPKLLYFLPVLTIIWANSHSGFFLGPIIVLFLLIDSLIKYFLKTISQKYLITIAFLTGLSFMATLINPYGFGIYGEVLRHSNVAMNTLIAEWVPPQAWQIFLVLSLTVWLTSRAWLRKDFFSIFLLVFTTYLTILARRNLPLFSVVAVYSILNNLLENSEEPLNNKNLQKIGFVILIVATAFVGYKNLPSVLAFDGNIYCQKALVVLPCRGVDFMMTQKPGRIFNAYEWGGYLIWKLPKFKIFVDGRMPSWDTTNETNLPQNWQGKSPYSIYIETLQTQSGWEQILRNFQTDYVMIQKRSFLDLVLMENPEKYGFKNIYTDDYTSIYRKN